ncbi:MAG: DNA alkylation repair protein [Lachnospiraceae bacterium]
MNRMDNIRRQLLDMADPAYKDFQSKLIPTVAPGLIIGIRTPVLRKYAKALAKQPEREEFLGSLPHVYYEENNLHGFLLETLKDYEGCIQELNRFLPFVDNWATCDMMSIRVLKAKPDKTLGRAREWIDSSHTYVCRFGIKVLMDSYLEEHFSEEIPELVAGVCSEEYYVKMMQAWFFATALAKQYEAVFPYLQRKRLPSWVHNKTIQKARESHRISPEQKEELKALKVKL